jgi:putative phosphoesterase
MLLGLLSDTHNSLTNLQQVVREFRTQGIQTVLHCGDLTDLETALLLVEFQVICTFGNGDWNANEIQRGLSYYRDDNICGIDYRGEIGGVKIAATHGHLHGMVENLVQSGEYAFVFHGHTHRHKHELIGRTHLVNPGALGGRKLEARSFAIIDLSLDQVKFHYLD